MNKDFFHLHNPKERDFLLSFYSQHDINREKVEIASLFDFWVNWSGLELDEPSEDDMFREVTKAEMLALYYQFPADYKLAGPETPKAEGEPEPIFASVRSVGKSVYGGTLDWSNVQFDTAVSYEFTPNKTQE